jgi:hypothetical protein
MFFLMLTNLTFYRYETKFGLQTQQFEAMMDEQTDALSRVKKDVQNSLQIVNYKMNKVDELLQLKDWIRLNLLQAEEKNNSKIQK